MNVANVMFSQVSVCPQGACLPLIPGGCLPHPPRQTSPQADPLSRHPPHQTPPGRHPLTRHPLADTPRQTPLGQTPPWAEADTLLTKQPLAATPMQTHPPRQTPPGRHPPADTPPCTVHARIVNKRAVRIPLECILVQLCAVVCHW